MRKLLFIFSFFILGLVSGVGVGVAAPIENQKQAFENVVCDDLIVSETVITINSTYSVLHFGKIDIGLDISYIDHVPGSSKANATCNAYTLFARQSELYKDPGRYWQKHDNWNSTKLAISLSLKAPSLKAYLTNSNRRLLPSSKFLWNGEYSSPIPIQV